MTASPPTSLTLLGRLAGGDAPAWARLFDVYAPLFRAWLRPRGVQPADVDDLTQTALAVVHRRLPDFAHNGRPGAFRTWLRGIVAHVLRDHLRAARRRPAGFARVLAEVEDPASELSARWDADHDRYVLCGLMGLAEPEFAPATWAAFRLTALDGRTVDEAATELGLTANAVRVARCRVLARLRREAEGLLDPF
ncbi:MAG: sigma-70 family RNA polymerase sigma factor [Gemmataceae bacterium]|nr:sigma-70 family RNA polymerase sigma factor [Gemmataceae bacterium]